MKPVMSASLRIVHYKPLSFQMIPSLFWNSGVWARLFALLSAFSLFSTLGGALFFTLWLDEEVEDWTVLLIAVNDCKR